MFPPGKSIRTFTIALRSVFCFPFVWIYCNYGFFLSHKKILFQVLYIHTPARAVTGGSLAIARERIARIAHITNPHARRSFRGGAISRSVGSSLIYSCSFPWRNFPPGCTFSPSITRERDSARTSFKLILNSTFCRSDHLPGSRFFK